MNFLTIAIMSDDVNQQIVYTYDVNFNSFDIIELCNYVSHPLSHEIRTHFQLLPWKLNDQSSVTQTMKTMVET